MKSYFSPQLGRIIFFAGIAVGGWVSNAWAAEPLYDTVVKPLMDTLMANFTRARWDTIMRWVNFGILVAVFFKYAKKPLSLFIKGKREETARSIQQLEERKSEAQAKIRDGRIQLEASKRQLDMIKERIEADGLRRKKQIIDQASHESQRMLEGARLKIDSQIEEAYNAVRLELIDKAAEIAAAKLPNLITEIDQEQQVQQWMDAAQK